MFNVTDSNIFCSILKKKFKILKQLPMFLDMFIEALFTSKGGTKINNDFVHKYVFVLAYAASVIEHYDDTVSLINYSSINLLLHNTFRHLRFFLILLYVDCSRLNSSFMKSQNYFTG